MRVLRVVLAGVASFVAGLGFGPLFGGLSAALAVAVGSVVTIVTAVALGAVLRPRLTSAWVVLIGSAAIVVTIAGVVRPGSDVLHGPWRLLTGALPADPSGPGLAAVAALTGWTALAGGLLAARVSSPLPPLLPPLGCLIVALAMGASGRPLPAWYPLVIVVLAAAIIATGRWQRLRLGQLLATAVVAGIAVAGSALLAPSAPGVGLRPPADARALVDAPVLPRTGVSPLQQFPALRNGKTPVRLSGTVTPELEPRLRMVSLDQFDGTFWTVRADYYRAGTRLPDPPPTTAHRVEVRQQVRLDLPGPLAWLPSAGRLTSVSVPGLGVHEASGDVTVPADRPVPEAYSATSEWHKLTSEQIRAGEPTRTTGAVTMPPEVRSFADGAIRGQPSGSGSLLALLDRFAGTGSDFLFDLSADAAGGHGYYQIGKLLKDKRGTAEQYASAYAIMARYLGYESRVVMGFRPHYAGAKFTVTAKDVDVWAEVHYAGLGWVPFDASPRDRPVGTTEDAPPPKKQPEPEKGAITPPVEPAPPASAPETAPAPAREDNPVLLVTLAVVGAVLLMTIMVPIAKLVRRARRRRLPPRESIRAAWLDALDRLREAGLPTPAAWTTAQVVSRASATPATSGAGQPLGTLATMADHACFAPDEPEPAMPSHAWTVTAEVRARVRRGMRLPRRLLAFLDPRPLFR